MSLDMLRTKHAYTSLKTLCLTSLLLTFDINAGLTHPKLGEIDDEFWITWNGSSYEGKLTLNSENNIELTITSLGVARPPRRFTLHTNLIESLSLNLQGDNNKKYMRFIVALISVTAILPKYQYSPDLTLPSCAQTSTSEFGLSISLSALTQFSQSIYSDIVIQQQGMEHNFNVTINGLDDSGNSESISVQFSSEWVVTSEIFTWFDASPGSQK